MTGSDFAALLDQLGPRDLAVLDDIERFRLLSARQVQRLHFPSGTAADARSANRLLARLRRDDLIRTLQRRVGGVRAGSAGFVYHLGPSGDRLQRARRGDPRPRRRYSEPSRHFVQHTLAIAELGVCAVETSREGHLDILQLTTEPHSWQSSLSPHGVTEWLKPDLLLVTARGEFEEHWFIEVDLGTEHLPVVLRQCQAYQDHFRRGRYQAAHGLYPTVLWVAHNAQRAAALRAGIARAGGLDQQLFRICDASGFLAEITGQASTAAGQ